MPVYRRFVNIQRGKKVILSSAQKLKRRVFVVSFCTFLSRILGFFRDILFAGIFGASGTLDAFLMAFKIPNFFRRLFGEGAFSQAFVPVLVEWETKYSAENVLSFISRIFTNLSCVLLVLVALVECFAPLVVLIFAPGFWHDPTRYHLAIHLLRITFPYILLISLTALAGGVLNTRKHFVAPAFAPVLLNISLIGAALFFSSNSQHAISFLAIAVVVGGCLQLALQVPVLMRFNVLPRIDLNWHDVGVRRVLKLMLPALFGVSVAQISLLLDNFFASFLPSGSLSWLYYSDRLTYLPLGVIGVAVATVVLPDLSRQKHSDLKQYSATIDWALQTVLWVGVPATLALVVLGGPILATVFMHGNYGTHDVIMTQYSLWAFASGLPAFMLIKVLASAFYASQNVKTPVRIAVWALVINFIGNVILIHSLAHAGLALATTIAAYANAFGLFYMLRQRQIYVPQTPWYVFFSRIGVSCALMLCVLLYLCPALSVWLSASLAFKVLNLACLVVAGLVVYFVSMYALGWRWR